MKGDAVFDCYNILTFFPFVQLNHLKAGSHRILLGIAVQNIVTVYRIIAVFQLKFFYCIIGVFFRAPYYRIVYGFLLEIV
jgi:hypothetical protein